MSDLFWLTGYLVKGETERIYARILELAFGSGHCLVRVLQRKLAAVQMKFWQFRFPQAALRALGLDVLLLDRASGRQYR